MQHNLSDFRKSYQKGELIESQIPLNPLDFFNQWFGEAANHKGVEEVNAMTVATIDADGFPGSRVVLLKGYSVEGFVFYTNFESNKGKAIIQNPKVCLSFFWPALERQIIIKGEVEKVSEEESTIYFNSRPRGSQIGAHASSQSSIVPSREFLEEQLTYFEQKFEGVTVPKPTHWGGLLVRPRSMEFWQGRANRLHDRILFAKDADQWQRVRLAP
ncbi:MAG: pyridoxamine 5'-phosphate oxidase [Flavobacteriaceae bacterium]|jgi:pyridoxamine 5'-phosphate oxidase|nr:pyridoxamine 5'-phosphate oxidase [Flavobacteriaceae bacterium]